MASTKRTQSNRPARITTALGEDVLLLKSMIGVERLGRPFEFELALLSEDHSIDYKKIVGTEVTVSLEIAGSKIPRYWNGIVTRFELVRYDKELVEYRATIHPWLSLLSRTADCQIFQKKSVHDVITSVFKDHEFNDFSDRTSKTYAARDYIVQYRESAFDFVSRLMEQEGIYYYFKHQKGKHTLVLCDGASSHDPYSGYTDFPYQPVNVGTFQKEHLETWTVRHEVQTGAYALGDFDFENTKKELRSKEVLDKGYAHAAMEFFDYPGLFTVSAEGDYLSKVRAQERQAGHEVFTAQGTLRGICNGSTFKMTGHPRTSFNGEYLITAARYKIEADDYDLSAPSTEVKFIYQGGLEAIESSVPFRTERTTPQPVVQGPQTAIVVGPSGEEIYTDKYGRIKVQFHWDRVGKSDENSSCFVRVSQAWAGNKWGAIYLPRVGQEVVVSFLEGDPNQPIVTGSVYNGENMPPYTLPDEKTKSTLKSNSSKGGAGYNELRFEDKKDSEQVYLHSQKDQDNRVLNDSKEWVGNNRHLIVIKDQYEKVGEDRHENIVRDHLTTVGRDVHLKIAGKEAIEVTGKLSLTVDGDVVEVFKGAHSEVVTKDLYLKGDNVCIEAGTNLTLCVGDAFIAINSDGIKISTPQKIAIVATGDLEQTGANVKVTANQDITESATGKVTISATSGAVSISSTGGDATLSGLNATLSGTTTATVKGVSVSVQGSAETAIKGAMVMIN
jgi:type VI secretion system secreted protein VgrG